jgi:hypothetical protein
MRMTMMVPLLLMLLLLETKTVHSFASNLIVSSIGCMTELDTSEVIMNNLVKSPEDSDFPKMHLRVVMEDNEDNDSHESPFYYRPDLGTTVAEITLQFVNPYTRDEFPEHKGLQFIIQLQESGGEGSAPGTSAEFVSGGTIGCDGNQRVSARVGDNEGKVQLQIHDVSASFKLWAGWATGQNAVRLTPPLLLEPGAVEEAEADANVQVDDPEKLPEGDRTEGIIQDSENKVADEAPKIVAGEQKNAVPKPDAEPNTKEETETEELTEEELQEERKLAHKQKRRKAENDPDPPPKWVTAKNKKEFVEAAKKMREIRKNRGEGAGRGDANSRDDEDPGTLTEEEEEERDFVPLSKERLKLSHGRKEKKPVLAPAEEKPPVHDEAKHRKQLAAQMEKNFPDQRSFRVRYEKGVELNAANHMVGSLFFFLAMAAVFFAFSKRRGEKGRREL